MIKFIKITAAQYAALVDGGSVNADYFYLLTDTNEFYLGERHLTDQDLSSYLTSVSAKDNSIAVTNNSQIAVKLSSESGNALQVKTTSGKEGLYVNVPSQTDYSVTITESTPTGVAKRYTVAQQGSTIGTIDIPKDMVIDKGSVVDITFHDSKLWDGDVDVTSKIKPTGTPTAADAGKYIKLEIANSNNDVLYISAKDLVDVYTAQQNATQVQLAIDSNNVISATIVAGSIGTTELAAKAVTDAKLSDAVNTSLGKADTALQAADIDTGSANGKISVKGTDVAVKGLGSAAYTESSAYATSAQGTLATNAVRSVVESSNNGKISVTTGTGSATDVAVHGLKSAAYTESSAYATAAQGTKADSAIQGIAEGASNGQIKYTVDGTTYTAVNVHGLDTAAYAKTTDFDAAGAANAVKGTSSDASTAITVYGARAYAKSYADGLASNYDAAGSAAAAETAAKNYADGLLTWETYSAS